MDTPGTPSCHFQAPPAFLAPLELLFYFTRETEAGVWGWLIQLSLAEVHPDLPHTCSSSEDPKHLVSRWSSMRAPGSAREATYVVRPTDRDSSSATSLFIYKVGIICTFLAGLFWGLKEVTHANAYCRAWHTVRAQQKVDVITVRAGGLSKEKIWALEPDVPRCDTKLLTLVSHVPSLSLSFFLCKWGQQWALQRVVASISGDGVYKVCSWQKLKVSSFLPRPQSPQGPRKVQMECWDGRVDSQLRPGPFMYRTLSLAPSPSGWLLSFQAGL